VNLHHHANVRDCVRGWVSCHASAHHHVNVRDRYLAMAHFLFHGCVHVTHHLHVNVHEQLHRVGKQICQLGLPENLQNKNIFNVQGIIC
jgi:hypothetical protein